MTDASTTTWGEAFALYTRPRLLAMLFLGFSAGLPLPLTGFTLRYWFSEAGLTLSAIGLTAYIGLAYTFKFLWSPAIDRVRVPWLTGRLGRRRGWLLPIQIALAAAIASMALFDPRQAPLYIASAAVAVAFLSASQDVVIDAYRIESLRAEEQGAGLAAYIWGYRIALQAGVAGALFLADFVDWRGAYLILAAGMGVGIATCLIVREPAVRPDALPAEPVALRSRFKLAVVDPFLDFAKRDGWAMVLGFVALFKLGEALAGIMTPSLYVSLGFARAEIRDVNLVFGLAATLAGVAAGGVLVARFGVARALIGTGVLQMLSNLMYVALARSGRDVGMLWLQVGIENFTDGLADAAFVAYLSGLTNVAFTATQYALLSSLAAIPLRTVGAHSGALAEWLGWTDFFLLTTAAALPGMAIMLWLLKRYPPSARAGASPPPSATAPDG
jgi:PAT family beta-lactamase induction signal transducer AmpG